MLLARLDRTVLLAQQEKAELLSFLPLHLLPPADDDATMIRTRSAFEAACLLCTLVYSVIESLPCAQAQSLNDIPFEVAHLAPTHVYIYVSMYLYVSIYISI